MQAVARKCRKVGNEQPPKQPLAVSADLVPNVSPSVAVVRKRLLLMAVLVAVLALNHLNGRQLEIALFPVKDLLTPTRCPPSP